MGKGSFVRRIELAPRFLVPERLNDGTMTAPQIDLEALSSTEHGYTVDDEDDEDDPILLDQAGNDVDTWRERYPYDARMPRKEYERTKRRLQIELLKLQNWSKRTGARHVIVFEGRDASWRTRGGGIGEAHRKREVTVVLPALRAGVERVMGFCTPEEYDEFMRQAPMFEDMLVSDGMHLTKFWFSVSPAEQRTRFAIRLVDPVRQWKFSPMDMESVDKWEEYTAAKEQMFRVTDTDSAPWIVVKSNDKKRARINAMRHLLAKFDYDEKDHELVGEPDPQIVGRALED
jgi:polyphosphate kinase